MFAFAFTFGKSKMKPMDFDNQIYLNWFNIFITSIFIINIKMNKYSISIKLLKKIILYYILSFLTKQLFNTDFAFKHYVL